MKEKLSSLVLIYCIRVDFEKVSKNHVVMLNCEQSERQVLTRQAQNVFSLDFPRNASWYISSVISYSGKTDALSIYELIAEGSGVLILNIHAITTNDTIEDISTLLVISRGNLLTSFEKENGNERKQNR